MPLSGCRLGSFTRNGRWYNGTVMAIFMQVRISVVLNKNFPSSRTIDSGILRHRGLNRRKDEVAPQILPDFSLFLFSI